MTQMDLSVKQRHIRDIENRPAVAKWVASERQLDPEFKISTRKLVYIERINNKVLRYSTVSCDKSHWKI